MIENVGMRVGASATLSRIEDTLRDLVAKLSESETRIFVQIIEMLRWFAGKIRIRTFIYISGFANVSQNT